MKARLFVVLGKTTKRVVVLHLPAVLGRSREADVTVAHPLISRRHCEISENNGLLMLRDLSSLNGTMIGGRRIELAPLLPDEEFTIGPLTFRVLYEYGGDLESIPAPCFADDKETIEANRGEPASAGVDGAPMRGLEEALPAAPADDSPSGELSIPDLMVLADADLDAVIPAAPAPRGQGPAFPGASPWPPPVAVDMLPTIPMTDALDEPMEVDPSLQSGGHRQLGGHRRESPWGAEPPDVEGLQHLPLALAAKGPPEGPESLPETTLAQDDAEEPADAKPRAANPPLAKPHQRPSYDDEIDPEFGSFLDGLQ